MMKLILLCLLWMLFNVTVHAQDSSVVTYTPDNSVFANPERGFYAQDALLWLDTERNPQSLEFLLGLRDEGISLVRWYILIDEFRDSPIDDETLDYLNEQFNLARTAGIKVILRFSYNFPEGGEYPFTDPDASLEQVLAHIEQIQPFLTENADVIAFMEAGFIGAWGEWHSSTNGLVGEGELNDNSIALIDGLLAALPEDRMVALRYPPHKFELYPEPLTAEQAFSGTRQARLGAHNDCFSASMDDYGTYPFEDIETLKAYIHEDNRYLPQGGETCNDGEEAQPYIGCDVVIPQMEYLHYSALNRDYHEGVLQGWQDEGCYDEIARRMGYHFRLISAEIPTEASVGGEFMVRLTLENDGFASPYNPRTAELVFRDGENIQRVVAAADVRWWQPGQIELEVPVTLPEGNYEVLLALPDPYLPDRPEYAIRMANEEVWEAETGMNHLGVEVVVTP